MKKSTFTRILTAIAAASMLSFTGCNGGESSSVTESDSSSEVTEATDATEATEEATEEVTEEVTEAADADQSLQKVLDSGKFILGLDATFKPMGYTNENDEIVGFDIDVAGRLVDFAKPRHHVLD